MMNASMGLETNYELLEMLRDDGVQTFRGRETATGRNLEIHLFYPFGRPENKPLFERLKTLPLGARRHFLDLGADGSTPYIVTDPLPNGAGFKTWVETLTAPPSLPQPPLPSTPAGIDETVQILQAGQWRTGTPLPEGLITTPPKAPPPRDFTTIFRMPEETAAPVPPEEDLPETETIVKPGEFTGMFQKAAAQPPASEPGEFTRFFQAPSLAEQAPPEPPPPPIVSPGPPPPQSLPQNQTPGEFTRMFQAPGQAPEQAPGQTTSSRPIPPPQTGAAGAGEFTKFFQNPLEPGPLAQSPQTVGAGNAPPPPAPPPPKRSSEFTEMFGRPAGFQQPASFPPNAPPPPIHSAGPAAGSASGMFSSGGQAAAGAPPQRFPSGPSEYTKMIASASIPTLGQTAPAPPARPTGPAPKSNLPLYIAIGIFALLAISIVLFFALRTR